MSYSPSQGCGRPASTLDPVQRRPAVPVPGVAGGWRALHSHSPPDVQWQPHPHGIHQQSRQRLHLFSHYFQGAVSFVLAFSVYDFRSKDLILVCWGFYKYSHMHYNKDSEQVFMDLTNASGKKYQAKQTRAGQTFVWSLCVFVCVTWMFNIPARNRDTRIKFLYWWPSSKKENFQTIYHFLQVVSSWRGRPLQVDVRSHRGRPRGPAAGLRGRSPQRVHIAGERSRVAHTKLQYSTKRYQHRWVSFRWEPCSIA